MKNDIVRTGKVILIGLVVCCSIGAILGCLSLSWRKSTIERMWDEHVKQRDVSYDVEVKSRDLASGVLKLTLDDEYNYDYVCRTYPGRVYCDVKFEDGSSTLGEHLWNVNLVEINKLLVKYRDTIVKDQDKTYLVKDEVRMVDFFEEYRKLPGLNKAYEDCKLSFDERKANGFTMRWVDWCPNYMELKNVMIDGLRSNMIDLFDWAASRGL